MQNISNARLMSPKAASFELSGQRASCLLVHGFTGTPYEMRPLGDFLHAQDIHVRAPLLPGHGTSPSDLMKTTWQQWFQSVEQALQELEDLKIPIFLCGFSVGGILSILLAKKYPHLVRGLAVLASPFYFSGFQGRFLAPIFRRIPFYPWLKPYYPKMDTHDVKSFDHIVYDRMPTKSIFSLYDMLKECRKNLAGLDIPTLLIYSEKDPTVPLHNFEYIMTHLGSQDKETLLLEKSGHIITKDLEQTQVFTAMLKFITRRQEAR